MDNLGDNDQLSTSLLEKLLATQVECLRDDENGV
jgi:hypothetical protein